MMKSNRRKNCDNFHLYKGIDGVEWLLLGIAVGSFVLLPIALLLLDLA